MIFSQWKRKRTAATPTIVVASNGCSAPEASACSEGLVSESKSPAIKTRTVCSSLFELCSLLRQNLLTELKIGWSDSDYLTSYANVRLLCRAILVSTLSDRTARSSSHAKPSVLKAISIGWRCTKRSYIAEILQALASSSPRLVSLQHLQIVQVDRLANRALLPVSHLQTLLLNCRRTLRCIEFRGFQVFRDDMLSEELVQNGSVLANCVIPCYSLDVSNGCSFFPLESLSLIDCYLTNEQATALSGMIEQPGLCHLRRLSVRGNKTLGNEGIAALCHVTSARSSNGRSNSRECSIDLSLCGLDDRMALAIAAAITAGDPQLQRQEPLLTNTREGGGLYLNVSANPAISARGIAALTTISMLSSLTELDLSFCDFASSETKILSVLSRITESFATRPNQGHIHGLGCHSHSSNLTSLKLLGCHISSDNVAHALCQLLSSPQCTLRKLYMHFPLQPKRVCAHFVQLILSALRSNYELEILEVDSFVASNEAELDLWAEVQFYLRLNRLGRRVLLSNKPAANREWCEFVAKAASDDSLDCAYWALRASVHHFQIG
jgi:Leucine Rich repeat